MARRAEELRNKIKGLVYSYYEEAFPRGEFIPGETPVPVSGRVFDPDELTHLVDSALEFWLTTGRYADRFERDFARFMGVRRAVLCNSGSSANLLALSALTSPELGERRLKPGDEVITVAAAFPTTVNPIIQNGLVPVFLDIELATYTVDVSSLEDAITPKTKAVMMAHTMGNAFDLDTVMGLAESHDLWVIEDNCDALGTMYKGKPTGSFGDLATVSFYPAHHITMGEGGCVLTNDGMLKKLVESFRDWGRDCWCEPGKANTCRRRFDWQLGDLPHGYDHKYIYSHVGYNLKLTDLQAAVGVAQLKKLERFIEIRKRNWRLLYEGLKPFEHFLLLPQPTPGSDPSWFGFIITLRPEAPFSRKELVCYLEARKIATRMLFGGNLIRQPAYQNAKYRKVGELTNSDLVMARTLWMGVYPGISVEMIEYVLECMRAFLKRF